MNEFSLERRSGDIRLAIKRILGHLIIGSANAHFSVARADVKSGLNDQCAGNLFNLLEFHGAPLVSGRDLIGRQWQLKATLDDATHRNILVDFIPAQCGAGDP